MDILMHPALKIAAVVTALIIGFFANDLRQLASSSRTTSASLSSSIDDYCLISTHACEQDEVVMTLDQDTARPLVPFTMTVNWKSAQSETLMLDMKGLEMEMGTIKYQLTSIGENTYQAVIMLPVCTTNKMTWVGTLTDGNQTVFPALRMEQ